jgi:signal peptidase II
MRAWRSPRAWTVLLLTFASALALDLWSKEWAFRTVADRPVQLRYEDVAGNPSYSLPWHAGIRAIPPDLLDFRLVLNHGAVFGIGQQRRELFIVFTIIATVAAVMLFARATRVRMRASHVAIGLILAGGIGNLYDRIIYGAVRDFLHMLPGWSLPNGWRWPGTATGDVFPWVFNVADVMLLCGMGIFIVTSFMEDRRARRLELEARGSSA